MSPSADFEPSARPAVSGVFLPRKEHNSGADSGGRGQQLEKLIIHRWLGVGRREK